MKKMLSIWKYFEHEFSLEGEEKDIQISINSQYWVAFAQEIVSIGYQPPTEYDLMELPNNCPYNYDNHKKLSFGNHVNFNKLFFTRINNEESKIMIDEEKKYIYFTLNNDDLAKFVFMIVKSTRMTYIYENLIYIKNIQVVDGENTIDYQANLVFWGNDKGKPYYIP